MPAVHRCPFSIRIDAFSLKRFTRTQDVPMILSLHNTIPLCTMLTNRISILHGIRSKCNDKAKRKQAREKWNKSQPNMHPYNTERLCMQKCRSCHQNNTKSSINMIIVAVYYDFSDTILTARRPMQTFTPHSVDNDNDCALLSTTFARSLRLRGDQCIVRARSHTEEERENLCLFAFPFLYASAMCRTIPISCNATHVSDMSAVCTSCTLHYTWIINVCVTSSPANNTRSSELAHALRYDFVPVKICSIRSEKMHAQLIRLTAEKQWEREEQKNDAKCDQYHNFFFPLHWWWFGVFLHLSI